MRYSCEARTQPYVFRAAECVFVKYMGVVVSDLVECPLYSKTFTFLSSFPSSYLIAHTSLSSNSARNSRCDTTMDWRVREDDFSCSMCFFTAVSNIQLMQHVLRYHKYDPQFQVECKQQGCGATFKKWNSFRQHLYRKHNQANADEYQVPHEEDENMEDVADMPNDFPVHERGDNEDENREPLMDPKERLEWFSAQFIVSVRENCKISDTAMGIIIDGVTSLVEVYSSILIQKFEEHKNLDTEAVNFQDIVSICREDYPPSILFSSVKSRKTLDRILIRKFNMVPAQQVTIGSGLSWKQKKQYPGPAPVAEIVEVSYDAYVVPFLDNLRNLLANDEVRSHIEQRRQNNGRMLRTVLDGSYYRHESEFFRNNENALAIILYYDDLGITNPLGATSKTHKMSMFYWTLANINPEVRSTLNTINLLAIVRTEYLKKTGALVKILEPFISDIKTLRTNGIDVNVRGQLKNFKGSLLFCAGDTPASALLGGFKESVSAYRPCRTCMTTNVEYKRNFRDDAFILRDKVSHQEHVSVVTDPTITRPAREFWKKQYGINGMSPLLNIPDFDVTTCLPHDAMHILIECIVEIMCRLTLRYCITELKLFTIVEFNQRLKNFGFKHFKGDKPAPIQYNHLIGDGNLRQSAAQMLVLANTLPFLISEWTMNCQDQGLEDRISCHIEMLQILNVCLAYEIHINKIDFLSRMIEIFILRMNRLYPDCSIVPKFHFLVHIPRYMKLFGPARQQWCFRFEGAHAYFKSLVSVVRNFKNMAFTLCYRHQARLCSRLASHPEMPSKKFLYKGDCIAPGPTVLLGNLPYARIFTELVDETEWFTCQMMRSSKIVVLGTSYHSGSIILLECNRDSLPAFGEVSDMFILGSRKLLVILLLQTIHYEKKLNAYHVTQSVNARRQVLNIKNVIFPHSLSSFTALGQKYVPLLNHQRTEFAG